MDKEARCGTFETLEAQNQHTRSTRQDRTAYFFLPTNLTDSVSTPQADFFIGYNVGFISQPEKFMGHSSCYADFGTHLQAVRAIEDMDGMPLLGRKVEIEFAQ